MIQNYIEPSTKNAIIHSPYLQYPLAYAKNNELNDPEVFESVLYNAIRQFRKSRVYTNYKAYLMSLGLNRCQVHGNITSEMADLEMHHCILTIYDIGIIILNHMKNTGQLVTTFDIFNLLRQEHTNNRVMVVMLSVTPHELYHNDYNIHIDFNQCFGKWIEFLSRYPKGMTVGIANKLIKTIDKSIMLGGKTNYNDKLKLREFVKDCTIAYGRYNIDVEIKENYE